MKNLLGGFVNVMKDVSSVAKYIATVSIEEEKDMLLKEEVKMKDVDTFVKETDAFLASLEDSEEVVVEEVVEVVVSEEVKEEKEMKEELTEEEEEESRHIQHGKDFGRKIIDALSNNIDSKVGLEDKVGAKLEAFKNQAAIWSAKGNRRGHEDAVVVEFQKEIERLEREGGEDMENKLMESANKAVSAGVPEEEVLRSIEDVDAFFSVAVEVEVEKEEKQMESEEVSNEVEEDEMNNDGVFVGLESAVLNVFDRAEYNPFMISFLGGIVGMAAVTGEKELVLMYDDHFLGMDAETRRFVLLHEMAHVINGDLDDIINDKKSGLVRNDKIEFAADAYAANIVGEKSAVRALANIASVVMEQDSEISFFAEQINESLAEIRRRAQVVAGVKIEERKVGNIMKKVANNVKGLFGLGVAAGAPNSDVEVELEEEKQMKTEALVVKNKAEKEIVYYVDDNGFIYEDYKEGCTPIISIGFTMQQLQMASLQDFHQAELMEKDKLAKMLVYLVNNVESSYAKTLLGKEVKVINGLKGILADLSGRGSEVVYGTFEPLKEGNNIGTDFSSLIKFKPGFAGPGHKRKGMHGILGESTSYLEYVTSLGLDLESFAGSEFNLKKIGTRVLLSGSSVSLVPIFDGFMYEFSVPGETYSYLGGEIQSTLHILSNGYEELTIEVIPEDFTVEMTEVIKGSVFNGDEAGFDEFKANIEKLATDGAAFFDPAVAKRGGLEHAFTFRFAQLAKGLGVIVPELRERLFSDIILFGGSVKADILPYLKKNQLDFGVITNARLRDSKLLKLSRQAAKRVLNKDAFAYFAKRTDAIIQGVIDLDMDIVSAFLSVGVGLDEEEMEVIEPTDIQISHLYHANPELVLGEAVLRKRLRTFLYAQLKKYANGEAIIVEECVWRHMIVDPYAIMTLLEAGMMSAKAEDIKVGIRRNHTLTVNNSTGELESKEALLVRFPITHKDEGRVVNREKGGLFADGGSFNYYGKYAEYFRGLVVFSLLDLNPEAMAGADFDGDACTLWTLEMVVKMAKEYTPFLDFSMVDGKLVSGAPFEDVRPVDYGFLSNEDKKVMEAEGVFFTETGKASVAGNLTDEVQELLWKVVAYVSIQTLEPGFVGLLTNISDTVVEFMTTVEDAKQLEKLDRLNNFLTAAIRWEIDKTKHGGAFYDALPFLKLLLGMESANENKIKKLEKEFDIILAPFFYKAKNDDIKSWTSQSLYYTYDINKMTGSRRMMINSLEHRAILNHRNLMEGIVNANNAERSHFYNMVAYARDVVAEGYRAGVITKDMIDWFDCDVAKNASPVKHPVALVLRTNKAIANWNESKRQYALIGDVPAMDYCDKKIKEVKEAGIALGSTYNMLDDKYIFALTYLSVAKYQNKLGGRKADFIMSYANGVFNYLAKQAMAFLGAKDVKGLAGNKSEVITLATDAVDVQVGDVLDIKHGAFDGGRINIESAFKYGLNGQFAVSKVIVSNSAHLKDKLVIYGRFVNNDTPKGGEDMEHVEELGQEYVDFEVELALQDWNIRELTEAEEVSVEVSVDSVDEEFIPSAEVTSLSSLSSSTEINSVVLDLVKNTVDSQYTVNIDGSDYTVNLKDIINIQDSIDKHFGMVSDNVYRQLFVIGIRRLFNLHTGNTTVLN